MRKTINGFKFETKEGTKVKVTYKEYTKVFDSTPEAGEWAYNMSPNNDIGNDTCRKLTRWIGINMVGDKVTEEDWTFL